MNCDNIYLKCMNIFKQQFIETKKSNSICCIPSIYVNNDIQNKKLLENNKKTCQNLYIKCKNELEKFHQ